MATNINLGGDHRLQVQEDPATVLDTLRAGMGGWAKLTMLHQGNKQPLGDVWINPAHVRFVNQLGG